MSQKYVPGLLIRNVTTGQPLLIVHVYRFCVFTIDPTDPSSVQIPKVILARDYDQWVRDDTMEMEQLPNGSWQHNPITL